MSLEEVRSYLNQVRRDFADKPLNEESIAPDPFKQYATWFEEAVGSQILDPYAACLSTVGPDGQPSSRILYIRDIIAEGFVFYTNYHSQKGMEMLKNPKAALNIHWGELERQIRIEGAISKASAQMSDEYFNKRPRESRIGAWASAQSESLKSRAELEEKVRALTDRFKSEDLVRPPHWGGYVLNPTKVEFWQGRSSRLHDRIVYIKEGDQWQIDRLSP